MLSSVNNILSSYNPFSFIQKNNTACGWNDFLPFCKPVANYSINQNEMNDFMLHYSLSIFWCYQGNLIDTDGQAELLCNIKNIDCQNQRVIAQLAIPNIKVNNPATLFGQNVAEITVKWNKFQAYLDKTFADDIVIDGQLLYESKLNSLISDFKRKQTKRFTIYPQKKYKMYERKYQIDSKIVISRLQRALATYKYDEANSFFKFSDIMKPVKSTYQQVESKYTFTVNVFPEANSASVLVYEMTYNPIKDSFSNKTVFGEKEIVGIMQKKLINNIESIIM